MNQIMLALFPLGTTEMILIVAVLFLLFGATKLPKLAKALGQSKRAFHEGQEEADEEARLEAARRRERLRAAETDAFDEDKAADKIPANKAR